MRNIALLLLLSVMVSGCNLVLDESDDEMPLSASFVVKDKFGQEVDTFVAGEEITFELRVTNTTGKDVTYQATGPGYDVSVRQGDTDIWSKFYGVAFAQVITDRVLKASDVLVLDATWSRIGNAGNPVAPGEYQVVPGLTFFVSGDLVPVPEPKVITLR